MRQRGSTERNNDHVQPCPRERRAGRANLLRLLLVAAFFVLACTASEELEERHGTWVGDVTTQGTVTTVVNESGSLWGGPAALVEEASIGVARGEPSEMLGDINGVAASNDRIYVADQSVPVVRAYTWAGEYVGALGGAGQGPGEYDYIAGIGVSDDGRVFVHARNQRRVNVYATTGEFLTSYRLPAVMTDAMVLAPDGTTYGVVRVDDEDAYYRTAYGYQAHGPDGPFGEILVAPRFEFEIPHLGGPRGLPVPHAPNYAWAMAPDGTLIAGVSHEYRFTMVRPDGSQVIVQRSFEPIPIDEEQRQYGIDRNVDFLRLHADSDAWDGPPVPHFMAAYWRFMPTRSGELWVIREGPGERYERPVGDLTVWRETFLVDAFDRDGRFLGSVDIPAGARLPIAVFVTNHGGPFAWVRDDHVIMPIEDTDGIIKVKRYRLTPPAEGSR